MARASWASSVLPRRAAGPPPVSSFTAAKPESSDMLRCPAAAAAAAPRVAWRWAPPAIACWPQRRRWPPRLVLEAGQAGSSALGAAGQGAVQAQAPASLKRVWQLRSSPPRRSSIGACAWGQLCQRFWAAEFWPTQRAGTRQNLHFRALWLPSRHPGCVDTTTSCRHPLNHARPSCRAVWVPWRTVLGV